MEKRHLAFIIFVLSSCTKSEISPTSYKDLEVSIVNISTAKVCLFLDDSTHTRCDDFDINYEPSLHYSKLAKGNYLITVQAGKRKKEERIFYNGGSQQVFFEF